LRKHIFGILRRPGTSDFAAPLFPPPCGTSAEQLKQENGIPRGTSGKYLKQVCGIVRGFLIPGGMSAG
jgi:hypothetical protein